MVGWDLGKKLDSRSASNEGKGPRLTNLQM